MLGALFTLSQLIFNYRTVEVERVGYYVIIKNLSYRQIPMLKPRVLHVLAI